MMEEHSFLAKQPERYSQQANEPKNAAGVARQDCPADIRMIAIYHTQQTHLEVSTQTGVAL